MLYSGTLNAPNRSLRKNKMECHFFTWNSRDFIYCFLNSYVQKLAQEFQKKTASLYSERKIYSYRKCSLINNNLKIVATCRRHLENKCDEYLSSKLEKRLKLLIKMYPANQSSKIECSIHIWLFIYETLATDTRI